VSDCDVLVVGAGPAGAVAAIVLARAGARVRLIDRAAFPRDKLCGDTINPGTLRLLRRLGLADALEARALPIDGMIVTGEGGIAVEGRYPRDQRGLAISRRDFDAMLLEQAVAAGAAFECVAAREAWVDGAASAPVIRGIVAGNGARHQLPAKVVVAADGRRSTIAFGLRLARHPPRPKRWAIGAYFEDPIRSTFGEMHIRRGRYIGVAPLGSGISNVCLVLPWSGCCPGQAWAEQSRRHAISAIRLDYFATRSSPSRRCATVSAAGLHSGLRSCWDRWPSTSRVKTWPGCCLPATRRASSIR
jgi:flavin-dependent dehydrogenase